MTVTASSLLAGPFTPNGATTTFPFTWPVFDASEITVFRRLNGVDTPVIAGFSVSGVGDDSGSVVFSAAPVIADGTLYIEGAPAFQQDVVLENQGPFLPTVFNAVHDQSVLRDLYLKDRADRSIQAAPGESLGSLPAAASRAGMVLGFDAGGDPVPVNSGGADSALRTDLAAVVSGAALVAYATGRTLKQKLGENVSVRDQNPVADGSTDDSVKAQAAVDSLTGAGGRLLYPAGTYKQSITLSSRKVAVEGSARAVSQVKPSTAGGVAMRSTDMDNSWQFLNFTHLGFVPNTTAQGVGLKTGPDAYTTNAEYVGRHTINDCFFGNFDKAILRPFGNIGLWISESQFQSGNYHIWSSGNLSGSGGVMHCGCFVLERSYMTGAAFASIYLKGDAGTDAGQVSIRDAVFEGNTGCCFYVDNFHDPGPVPAIVVENCWNEANYTAVSVTIDGNTFAPVWAYLNATAHFIVRNTPLGPLVLKGETNVVTHDCALDLLTSASREAKSLLTHWTARLHGGTAIGMVMSIGALVNTDSRNDFSTPFYGMPKPASARAKTADVLVAWDGQTVIGFTGSTSRNTSAVTTESGVLWGTGSQELTLNSGDQLTLPTAFTIPANRWVVTQYIAGLVSGPAVVIFIGGTLGFGGAITLSDSAMRCYTSVGYNNGADIAGDKFYHNAGASTSVIRIGGAAVTSFATAEEALAYANSGAFPSPVPTSGLVAGLPALAMTGARSFVTDANATTYLSTVAGGGANKVPVVFNGTNWIIGG